NKAFELGDAKGARFAKRPLQVRDCISAIRYFCTYRIYRRHSLPVNLLLLYSSNDLRKDTRACRPAAKRHPQRLTVGGSCGSSFQIPVEERYAVVVDYLVVRRLKPVQAKCPAPSNSTQPKRA